MTTALPVPGWLRRLAEAAVEMDVPRAIRPPSFGGRASAVLVLFGEGPSGPDLLFIQRAEGLRRHPGQPAFPGGAIEPDYLSPEAAALREAAEETGVDPAGVDVLGVLPELFIPRSDFRVVPVIAWWREPCAVEPHDLGEVAAVQRIPVADLADPARRVMVRGPNGRLTPGFATGGMLIWGFTAAVVDRLLAIGGWEVAWDRNNVRELGEGA
jgi:8-oxo-dGTP pyrophosphatase MutT (NUDIX family)